ncbi:MAG: efflux RND transporter periplasmic adaptor subunit [Tannerella sp.]|jgi:cobalt-zinc-cadmium efflux system membrane fusion protein|nr:efflux RND transporter periplasmic adaptor subunit [Tannerella sp.]
MKNLIIPLCLLVLFGCGNPSGNDDTGAKQFIIEGEQITVPENAQVLHKIKIQLAESGSYQLSFSAAGTVHAIPAQYAEIASPFAGRIVKSFVRIGQKITSGSPVFEISSPSFSEASKAYFQAKQEMALALKHLNRERDLLANKVGIAKEVEEAEANYELRKSDYEQALAAMQVYQSATDSAPGQSLVVRSPIAGEVLKSNIVTGQYIPEDAGALAVVADLDKVWVTAHVKEKDIPALERIAEIRIDLDALPGTPVTGAIYYTGGILDEDTRSIEVIIQCDNSERKIKPHMYGTVRFIAMPLQDIIVPNSAILQEEGTLYVIVSEGGNIFRKVNVTVRPVGEAQTAILSGVTEGEKIVTEGAFYFIDAR